ncbi:hypothetical protein PI125_g6281 [Phytophthora idaei]|nr:hypothetical protein PI125_g6281 [Phytophthora idaei]
MTVLVCGLAAIEPGVGAGASVLETAGLRLLDVSDCEDSVGANRTIVTSASECSEAW